MTFEDLENARKAYIEASRKSTSPVIISVALWIVIILTIATFPLAAVISFPVFIIDAYFLAKALKTKKEKVEIYNSMYKAFFLEQSINKIFTEVDYHHEAGMPASELKETGMIRMGDVYYSNDLFTAKYHNVSLKQADVDILQSHEDSDGNTYYTTVFKGRWMIYEFPKKFTFRLQVIQKGFNAAIKLNENRELKRKIKKITTESPTFNDLFMVYAEDDFEAYYLLDPAFIDHLEQISTKQQGKIMLCFTDNKLHIAIYDKKDAFEPANPRKPIDKTAELAKINQEIKTITDFVDFLKLDRKLFKNN